MNAVTPEQKPSSAGQTGGARFFGRRNGLQTPSEALHPDTPPPPPSKPHSQRRPMLSAISGFLSFLMIAAVFGLGGLSYFSNRLAQPGPLESERVVYIPPRTEVGEIIDQLARAKMIDSSALMHFALLVEGKRSRVKAGEFLFKQNASLNDVIDTLISGRQILHSITIPEGLTSTQIVERLRQNELLTGDVLDIPPEGTLLPETYRVPRGWPRAALIRKMQEDQTRMIDRLWQRRPADLPLRSKIDLITLASIVEKETGRADERTRVAGVFYNRLRRGMKLQSDPTIVYGLVGGKGTLGRPIQRDEIRKPTAYNTYVIPALPPGPIANPGRASLEATISPSRTNDLFFVANGTGGHTFAETLEQHNRNVVRWREIEKEMRAKAQQGGGPQTPDVDRVEEPAGQQDAPAAAPARRNNRRGDIAPGSEFGALPKAINGSSTSLAQLAQELNRRRSASAAIAAAAGPVQPSAKPQPPASAAAFAPTAVAAAPAATPAMAPVAKPASPFAISPGIGELGIAIAGVPAHLQSPVDGPVNEDNGADEAPATAGGVEAYPMSQAKRNEMSQRAAAYGSGAIPALPPQAAALPAATAQTVPSQTVARAAPARPRVMDASEGTRLDPLRDKSWDLNSAQTIPAFRTN